MTSKLDNKAGANWAVSGYEFFMAVSLAWLSKMGRGGKQEHFAGGLSSPLDLMQG